jgi:very-short-patch-repair endonuclease
MKQVWSNPETSKKIISVTSKVLPKVGKNTRYKKGKENRNWVGGLVDRTCKNCSKPFKSRPDAVKKGYGIYCSHTCGMAWYMKNKPNGGRTGIEIKMAGLLTKLGIEFEEQKAFPKQRTIPDFYLPKYKTIVYTDGTYWHRTKRRQFCDARINKRLETAGYSVLRYWENDINKNINWVAQDIKTNLKLD